jgi:hypothetical protein
MQTFLAAELAPERRFTHPRLEIMAAGRARGGQPALAKRGWSVPHMPADYGAANRSSAQRRINVEEVAEAENLSKHLTTDKRRVRNIGFRSDDLSRRPPGLHHLRQWQTGRLQDPVAFR